MSRTARIIAPDYPHHVTQRGNRRLPVFFCDDDYKLYLELMAEFCARYNVTIWAYCLMTNHVHMMAVPKDETGLTRAVGEAHRRYSAYINKREGWTGHLFQGRYASYVMDEAHALLAARYIEKNPVVAKMVKHPWDYEWSSARAHLDGKNDVLVKARPLLKLVPDWKAFIQEPDGNTITKDIESHSVSGWPMGNNRFLDKLSRVLEQPVRPNPRGRPVRKQKTAA